MPQLILIFIISVRPLSILAPLIVRLKGSLVTLRPPVIKSAWPVEMGDDSFTESAVNAGVVDIKMRYRPAGARPTKIVYCCLIAAALCANAIDKFMSVHSSSVNIQELFFRVKHPSFMLNFIALQFLHMYPYNSAWW